LGIALAYAIWSLVWTLGADALMQYATSDGKPIFALLVIKGLVFVLLTSVLLYLLLVRQWRRLMEAHAATEAATAERAARDEQVAYLSQHDALTGLPNRGLFADRLAMALAQAHRDNKRVAVMQLDLDHFKVINDSAGHDVGDGVLKAVARRLLDSVREGDTVARQGGDEFTLIFPNLPATRVAALIAGKLLRSLSTGLQVDGQEYFVNASIGIALYPDDAGQAADLLRGAEAAMYRAKQQGRNSYQFFTSDINARVADRLSIENGLRNALAREELRLVYQPQIAVATGRVVGLEALLRWTSAELGVITPDRFIPIAEEINAIVPIGTWVLRTACRQAAAWHQAGLTDLRVVVNMSARQFAAHDLVATVRIMLGESGIPPSSLELEITESDVMVDPEATIRVLRELRALGISISLDDFGTGYSSMSYLKRFDVDVLKIDRSFVRDIPTDKDASMIAASLIGLAHNLGMIVVAEGVEEEEQLRFLGEAGCDLIQGYLLSRPLEVEQVSDFVQGFTTSLSLRQMLIRARRAAN